MNHVFLIIEQQNGVLKLNMNLIYKLIILVCSFWKFVRHAFEKGDFNHHYHIQKN